MSSQKNYAIPYVLEWRRRRGFSQGELSGLSGVSAGYLSKVERGIREPSPVVKVRLARCLGVSVADLFPPKVAA